MMFIELTAYITGYKYMLNINNILSVEKNGMKDEDGTIIGFSLIHEDDYVVVRESYSQVKELIEREVQAERGL